MCWKLQPSLSSVSLVSATLPRRHPQSCCGQQYSTAIRLLVLPCRFLYDLSRDVQDLVRVLKLREDGQGSRIRELESVLRDWFDVFGSPDAALRAAGVTKESGNNTPSHVAARLKELSHAAGQMRAGVDAGRSKAERELGDMRLALRDASRVAREQTASEIMRIRAESDAAVAAERAARLAAEQSLAEARVVIEADAQRAAQEAVELHEANCRREMQQLKADTDAALRTMATQRDAAQRDAATQKDHREKARAVAADGASHHAAEVNGLREQLADMQATLARERVEAGARHDSAVATWSNRLDDVVGRYERSHDAARVAALEKEIAFLTGRMRELEAMVNVMQTALHGGATMLSSLSSPSLDRTAGDVTTRRPLSVFDTNVAAPIGTISRLARVAHVGAPLAAAAIKCHPAAKTVRGHTETHFHVVRAGLAL